MMAKYNNSEEVLADMPRFQKGEKECRNRGFKTDVFHKVANPENQFCFFFKNGKLGYKSNCPNYGGFYNDAPLTAIICKALDFLLPGVILDTYCRLHCEECPLHPSNIDNPTRKTSGKRILELPDAGTLEVDVHGNAYATISFTPSDTICENLAAQFCKTSATASKEELPPTTNQKINPAKQQNLVNHMDNDKRFSELSQQAMEYIKEAKFMEYTDTLSLMADVARAEGKRYDELKLLIIRFYVLVSGIADKPHIEWGDFELIEEAVKADKISEQQVKDLFFSTVHDRLTPRHRFSIAGSYRVFELARQGNHGKIGRIIDIEPKSVRNH